MSVYHAGDHVKRDLLDRLAISVGLLEPKETAVIDGNEAAEVVEGDTAGLGQCPYRPREPTARR